MIGEAELKTPFGVTAQRGAVSQTRPVFRWVVLTLIFSLLCFREYDSPDGLRLAMYVDAWGGFRPVDLLVLGLVYLHVLWILATRQRLPKVPRTLKGPTLLFLSALGISFFYGLYRHGTHVYFDWRNIFLGAGVAVVFAWWIKTPSELHEGVRIFCFVMGLLVLYILGAYAVGAHSVETVITGVSTPLYDGPTLSAVVLLTLFAFRYAPQERSSLLRIWWLIAGCTAFLLVVLSFRRTFWAELAIGVLILAALQKQRRFAAFALIAIVAALVVSLGGKRVYERAESMDPFVEGEREYTNSNEDHINDILDALDQVKEHPLLGIGLGKTYPTPRLSGWKEESWEVHNGLLHVWLLYGMLGLAAYLWFHVRLFRWLKRLQGRHPDSGVRAFCQAGLAWMIGEFLVRLSFAPWPYGALQSDVAIFFIIGSAMSVQRLWMQAG